MRAAVSCSYFVVTNKLVMDILLLVSPNQSCCLLLPCRYVIWLL